MLQGDTDNIKPEGKILLVLLPFWAPLIPPMGIASLKSFLKPYGYLVKTVDANIEREFEEIGNRYFGTLKDIIPANKRQRLQSAGFEVLRSHMIAHLHYKDEDDYMELIDTLVYKTFFYKINRFWAMKLKEIVETFYNTLEKYFLDLLEKENPTVLGLSVYNDTLAASIFAFKLTKEKYPHILTVMGGGIFAGELSVGSPNYYSFLEKTPYIDKIIVGEGEILLCNLLQGKLPESSRVYTAEDIGGKVLAPALLGIPDFSDLELSYYPFLAFQGSRSCPFQCAFCCETVFWGKYRKKSARLIFEELVKLYKAYGIQLFLMCDSLLNPFITDLAKELINSDISIYWDGYLRVDASACSTENTVMWRRGGFFRARLGLESGSPRMLDLMGKKITPAQIKKALRSLAYSGIKTTSYWVIGYPGETEEDFQQTLALIEELQDSIYEAYCNPFHYYLTGQVNSDEWARKNKSVPLYPDKLEDMQLLQQWSIDGYPGREEIYERANRFAQHCSRLGIPTIYSLKDIHVADERWKKLHLNAVPPLVDFMGSRDNSREFINENKNFREKVYGRNIHQYDGDWGF